MKSLNRNFVLLLAGVGISSAGDFMYLIAINLLIFELTGSATLVATLWILGPLAGLIIKSWSGGFVDRHSKKRIMLTTDLIRGVLVLILFFIRQVELMLAIIFLVHVCSAFFRPASQAYIVKLVPTEKRSGFNGLYQAASTGGIVIGPALAGIILVLSDPSSLILMNALSFFISLVFLAFLPLLESEPSRPENRTSFFTQLKEDRHVVHQVIKQKWTFVKFYLIFQVLMVIGMSLDALEWVFSEQVLGLSESQYSLLMSICGVGYVAGSLLGSQLPKFLSNYKLIPLGAFISVMGFFGYAYSISFAMALTSFGILGLGQAVANTSMLTVFQNTIPSELIGRFSNFFSVIISVMVIALTFTLGFFGDINVQLAVRVPVLGSILIGLVLFRLASSFKATQKDPKVSNTEVSVSTPHD